MKMTRLLLGFAIMVAFGALTATQSFAALVSANDIISFEYASANNQSYGGGEFKVYVNGGSASVFNTFCLEVNEHIVLGRKYVVESVAPYATMGGVSGGSPDPISSQTAWLYSNFFRKTLSGYSSANALDQKSLQFAFWVLEGEKKPGAVPFDVRTETNNWIALANAATNNGTNGDLYGVRVINPVTKNKAGQVIANNQSVLGVPEPGTMGLLGLGLVGMVFVSRRRLS